MKKLFYVIFMLAIIILVVIVAIENSEKVVFGLWNYKYEASFSVVLLTVFSVGLLTGVILFLPDLFGKRKLLKQNKELKNNIAVMEKMTKRLESEDFNEEKQKGGGFSTDND